MQEMIGTTTVSGATEKENLINAKNTISYIIGENDLGCPKSCNSESK